MATIESNAYGKTRVRLMRVDRSHTPHRVRELSVSILLTGEFESAYRQGDNSGVLPTDTMKNTVYVLARQMRWESIEEFAQGLASHFLAQVSGASQVTVDIEQVPWTVIDGTHAAFSQTGNERRTTSLKTSRSGAHLNAGLKGLQILKTADSGFSNFMRDALTTLPETHDRLFGTVLEAQWEYSQSGIDFNTLHELVRSTLLQCFARHHSLSVQHTLFAMGEDVLDRISLVASIKLVMPNKHCLLIDLSRFGLDNPNQIFVPTDEPSGYIEAQLSR